MDDSSSPVVPSGGKLVLGTWDYVIFGVTLLVSALVGLYFQFSSNRKKNNSQKVSDDTEDYLYGGRTMATLPVTFSLMATFMSASSMMGLPADVYLHGTHMAFMNVGFLIGSVLAAYVFLPIYFENRFTTAYEYLEKRFGTHVRRFVSGMFGVQSVLFTAATLYAPALALSAVTDLSLWASVLAVGAVCTFYSTLGGMKAVLWTDVFQALLMFSALIAILAVGWREMGLGSIFAEAADGGRLAVPSLSVNLSEHYTMWNVLAQSLIIVVSSFGGSQVSVQRLMSVDSLSKARSVCFWFVPMQVSFQLLCCMSGLVFYAYFRSCDPMTSPEPPIQSADQLMPYFISVSMRSVPGLPGLCIAGIFSASLSTVSSSLNSLAAVTHGDCLAPACPALLDRHALLATKAISLVFGCACIGLSFVMASLGNLMRLTILIVGMFAGPNLAVIILAACTTAANQEGVLVGLVASLGVGTYLSFFANRTPDPSLPLSTEQCPPLVAINATTTPGSLLQHGHQQFPLAYMWYSSVGLVTCLVVGYSVSLAVTYFKGGKSAEVPDSLLSPVRRRFSRTQEKKAPEEKAWEHKIESITRF